MTDEELIARLRGWARDIQTGSTAIWAMDQDLKAAADRIEQLVATNEALKAQVADHEKAAQENDPSNLWRFWANKAQEMADNNAAARQEAKLAKAVEALSDLMMHEPDHPDTIWEKARAALAAVSETHKIKGESHE